MKVKVPYEVKEVPVPMSSGQAGGYRMLVVPLRFCKQKFIGEAKSRFGHCYKTENGQHVGWSNYYRGIWFWIEA
jgi:hypothetical protein